MTKQADAWWFMDGDNKLINQLNADSIEPVNTNRFKIKTGNRVHLTDRAFKPLNELYFSSISSFHQNKALFQTLNNKTGVLNTDGAVIIPAKYESLMLENESIRASLIIENKIRWVVLDTLGKQISQKHYEFIDAFNGNVFPVKNRNYWGAVNRQGKEIVTCVHDSIIQSTDDLIVVKFKGKYGIIGTHEKWIVAPQPNKINLINDERYIETTPRTQFLKSIDGNIIYFSENPLDIKSDHLLEHLPAGAIWKIDFKGRIVDRFVYPEAAEEVLPESEGLRAIKKDGRYGFVDNQARLRIANRYEDVRSFSEGLAAAQIRGKWGFINKQDNIAVQPVYEEVFSFTKGVALVKQKDLFGLIDTKGKLVLPLRYADIKALPSNRFLINQNGLFGLAEGNGRVAILPKFNEIIDLNNGYIIVQRDGKYGLLTTDGVSTIPLLYDSLVYDKYHNQYIAMKRSEWEIVKI
jgi:hypothetical protein